eukprot:gene25969-31360_t
MEASIDLDFLVHFGRFKNIDLSQKGLYRLEVVLTVNNGTKPIAPIGLFSSSSTLESNVPSVGLIEPCEVDDRTHTFRTRPVLILYKDEVHELNEGVHYRLTFPRVALPPLPRFPSTSSLSNPPSIPDPSDYPLILPDIVHIQVSLMHAELAPYPSTVNPLSNPSDLLPTNPSFKKVAQSDIIAQRIGSVFQNYYPLQFDYLNCTNIDMLVYGYMTGIRVGRGRNAGVENILKHVLHNENNEGKPGSIVHSPVIMPPILAHTSSESTIGFESDSSQTPANSIRMYDEKGFLKGDITTKHHNPPPKNILGGSEDRSITAGGVIKGGVQYPSTKSNDDSEEELDEKEKSNMEEEILKVLLRGDSAISDRLESMQPEELKPPHPPASPRHAYSDSAAEKVSDNSSSFGANEEEDNHIEDSNEDHSVAWGESGARKYKKGAQRRASTLIIAPPMPPPTTTSSFLARVGGFLPKPSSSASDQPGKGVWGRWRGSVIGNSANNTSVPSKEKGIETHHPHFVIPHHTGKHQHPSQPPSNPASHLSALPSSPNVSQREDENASVSSLANTVLKSEEQVHSLYDICVLIHTHVHANVIENTQHTLSLYEKEVDASEGGGIHQQVLSTSVSILQQQREETIQKILQAKTDQDMYPLSLLSSLLSSLLIECELLLQLRVSLLIVAIRRVWNHVISGDDKGWKAEFEKERGAFWRGQVAVSTRSADTLEDVLYTPTPSPLPPLLTLLSAQRDLDKESLETAKAGSWGGRSRQLLEKGWELLPSLLPLLFIEQTYANPNNPNAANPSTSDRPHTNAQTPLLYDSLPASPATAPRAGRSLPQHLVICVHGFLGCEADMYLTAQALRLAMGESMGDRLRVYISKANERSERESIVTMGARLAEEIYKFIDEHFPEAFALTPPPPAYPRLIVSFITHSMGGVVLRTALHSPLLYPLQGLGGKMKLGVFISLACPHVGTKGGSWLSSEGGVNPLVRGGVWALSNKYKCLRELGCEDETAGPAGGDKPSCLIYFLSLPPSDIPSNHVLFTSTNAASVSTSKSTPTSPPDLLACFARVVLVSSPEDQYVPSHSASLSLPPSMRGSAKDASVEEMGRRVVERLGGLGGEKLVRVYILNYPAPPPPVPIHLSRYGRGDEEILGEGMGVGASSKGGGVVGGLLKGGMKGVDVDVLIGRKAHIVYVENTQVVRQLVFTLAPFFYALDYE